MLAFGKHEAVFELTGNSAMTSGSEWKCWLVET